MNFDWYHPRYAHRQTEEEVRRWCEEAGLGSAVRRRGERLHGARGETLMCGIAGVLNVRRRAGRRGRRAANDRRDRPSRPGRRGRWCDGAVGLGHRRLAIIDLSRRATSRCERGRQRRRHLQRRDLQLPRAARGARGARAPLPHRDTDTEVIVHAYEEWGDGCLRRASTACSRSRSGTRRRRLLLARDRFGVKPLYWWSDGAVFVFGSEVKALLAAPARRRRPVRRGARRVLHVPEHLHATSRCSKASGCSRPACCARARAGRRAAPSRGTGTGRSARRDRPPRRLPRS